MHAAPIAIAFSAILSFFFLGAAHADARTTYPFNLPEQPLSEALKAIGQQTATNILFDPQSVLNRTAPALRATLTAKQAIEHILQGTTLVAKQSASDTVLVQPPSPSSPATAKTTSLFTSGENPPSPREGRRAGDEGMRVAQNEKDQLTPDQNNPESPPKDSKNQELSEVVVTGTNIKGIAPAGSPVIVLDEQDIRRSGYTSVDQVIQSLPQNIRSGSEGASADGGLSTGYQAGFNYGSGSGANLRGLGSTATLTLINGHRISASSAGTFTDISSIPISAIERIEVLTDGASAIYGADAVAGVVNVILKRDFEGAESRLRYGSTAPSGRDEIRASQTLGHRWDSGNALLVADYLKQSRLGVDERDFTSRVHQPGTIFPENKQLSAVLFGSQNFEEKWSAQADAQIARADRSSITSSNTQVNKSPVSVDRTNVALSLAYHAFSDWNLSLDGQSSEEDLDVVRHTFVGGSANPDPTLASHQIVEQKARSAGMRASGSLLSLPAGRLALGLGATHRNETYLRRSAITSFREDAERDVDSAFAELYVPLFGAANARRGVQALSLSLAGRYDDYSDFGSTVNPKVGVSWKPLKTLEVRSSYSTSFRAPSTGNELSTSASGTFTDYVLIGSYLTPEGTTTVPMVHLLGSNTLEAEEAKNWTAGFTFRPEAVAGLQVGATYYDISYTNRIVQPGYDFGALANPALQSFITSYNSPAELQAAVTELLGHSPLYIDATGPNFDGGAYGANPENITTRTIDYRYTNAGVVKTNGFDFMIDYVSDFQGGSFALGLNVNRINKIATIYTPGAPVVELSNTTGNPARLRLRGTAAYGKAGWDIALALNYTGRYTDTSGITNTSVHPFFTADANLQYTLQNASASSIEGLSFALSVRNMLDKDPPFVQSSGSGSNYDTANADPLGRLIAVEVAKRW